MEKYENSFGVTMKNKKTLILITGIVLVIILSTILFFTTSNQKEKNVTYDQLALVSPRDDASKIEKIFSDDALNAANFAVTDKGVCFVDKNDYPAFYSFEDAKTTKLARQNITNEAARVVSTGSSCLFQFIGATKNSLFSYSGTEFAALDYETTGPVDINQYLYFLPQTDKFTVLSGKFEKVSEIKNSGDVAQVAPLSSSEVFEVSGYDGEVESGKITFTSGGQTKDLGVVQKALGLKANQNYALLTYQQDNLTETKLIDQSGKVITTIQGVDPSSIAVTNSGFYFATKPDGMGEVGNQSNLLGYVSNSGKITSYLSSVDETTNQFSISSIYNVAGYLYFLEGSSVERIKI